LCGHLPWCGETQSEISHNSIRGIYEEPEQLSRTVRDLIKKMLNPSPRDRITIQEIRTHPWINDGFSEPPPSLLVVRQPVFEVREEILTQLESLGYKNIPDCRRKILENELCEVVAIYHLLLDRIVDEEMAEIKKKLMHKKSSAPSYSRAEKTDPKERRLSSPTRAPGGPPKLAVIPEDAGSYKEPGPWGWSRHKHDGKPHEGRGDLTRSAPIYQNERPNTRQRAATHDNPDVAPSGGGAKWQHHRRASVAFGTPADLPTYQQKQAPKPKIVKKAYAQQPVEQNGADRRFSLDSRGLNEQMSQETGGLNSSNGIERRLSSQQIAGPRLVSGVFKSSTTTSMPPEEAAKIVKKCLGDSDLFVKRKSPYVFLCMDEAGVKFKVEVCKILQLDLTGVHLKRISGDIWKYKELCNSLVTDMKL